MRQEQIPALSIRGVSKAFGPVQALRDVGFDVMPGEIHALAGENGAGKSTLMKIISGNLVPDTGEVSVAGATVRLDGPAHAQSLGIGLVHQEIALCPDLPVYENMFMARTASAGGLMRRGEMRQQAAVIMNQLARVDIDALVGDLPISHQQLVEIAKALTLQCRILILDEPTAALTEPESQALFRILRRLREEGLAIIYISHRMAEIFDLCDSITVMRDGRYVSTRRIADLTPDDVVSSMVGRELSQLYPPKAAPDAVDRAGTPLLSVRGLADAALLRDIDFDLHRGEILGFSGLIGAGRTEIACALCGLTPRTAGDIRMLGREVRIGQYADSVRQGMVYLSEDRKHAGLFLDMPIAWNVSALDLRLISNALGVLSSQREQTQASSLGQRVKLKCGRITDPVSSLSGGNQQKVAIAKMLSVAPAIIILDEPTRGVDVGAKAEIYAILRELASAGVGIIVISSEMPELIGLCDRALVIHEGRLAAELQADQLDEQTLMRHAAGITPAHS